MAVSLTGVGRTSCLQDLQRFDLELHCLRPLFNGPRKPCSWTTFGLTFPETFGFLCCESAETLDPTLGAIVSLLYHSHSSCTFRPLPWWEKYVTEHFVSWTLTHPTSKTNLVWCPRQLDGTLQYLLLQSALFMAGQKHELSWQVFLSVVVIYCWDGVNAVDVMVAFPLVLIIFCPSITSVSQWGCFLFVSVGICRFFVLVALRCSSLLFALSLPRCLLSLWDHALHTLSRSKRSHSLGCTVAVFVPHSACSACSALTLCIFLVSICFHLHFLRECLDFEIAWLPLVFVLKKTFLLLRSQSPMDGTPDVATPDVRMMFVRSSCGKPRFQVGGLNLSHQTYSGRFAGKSSQMAYSLQSVCFHTWVQKQHRLWAVCILSLQKSCGHILRFS